MRMNEYIEECFKKSEHEEMMIKLEEINRRLKVLESGCLCPQYPYIPYCVPCEPCPTPYYPIFPYIEWTDTVSACI